MSGPAIPASYRALINSSRVSTGTRRALQARAAADDPAYRPRALTTAQLETLRAVVGRVLPQPRGGQIDLAAQVDAQLDNGQGDGWRFAMLPDDRTAYAHGLSVLEGEAQARHGQGFVDLADDLQDAILACTQAGVLQAGTPTLLDATQMRLWFEDVCTDVTKLWMAHPATLARIGYSGIGYGGDGDKKSGFSLIGLGERESGEPMPEIAPDTP